MKRAGHAAVAGFAVLAGLVVLVSGCGGGGDEGVDAAQQALKGRGRSLVSQGRHVFRYETFGDEAKWTDALRLHEAVSAAVDPTTALSVGLKVDADALPAVSYTHLTLPTILRV